MRDMTRAEFKQAIARRGWRQELMWVTGIDKEGRTCGIGLVMSKRGREWKTNYRATLAKAIRELQEVES